MNCYIDTSVVLASLLGQKSDFDSWNKIEYAFSSRLLLVECHRVLDRYRLSGEIGDKDLAEIKLNLRAFIRGVTLISISEAILERAAEPFSTVVGTLDAIHLSTALLWIDQNKKRGKEGQFLFLTYDEQLKIAAQASGI